MNTTASIAAGLGQTFHNKSVAVTVTDNVLVVTIEGRQTHISNWQQLSLQEIVRLAQRCLLRFYRKASVAV